MAKPDISVIVCTFERPDNLRRVLASLAGQRGVDGRFEVIVADDGSRDETPQVFERFSQNSPFPMRFVTHPHAGFCPGRSRNEGVANSQADYLLLLDGDCLIPPDHLRIQLARRRPGYVRIGDHIRMDEATSAGITDEMAFCGSYLKLIPSRERFAMLRKAYRTYRYNVFRHPSKPRLVSNNVGIWRKDYLAVNGFDENYVGWGCEDDDFGFRLRNCGLRLESSLWWTCSYHLWHPPVSTMPVRWGDGPNVAYFNRPFHLARCGNGIEKRTTGDVTVQIAGNLPNRALLNQILPPSSIPAATTATKWEVEFLFAPTDQTFSGKADCNVLVVPEATIKPAPHYGRAHLVMSDCDWPNIAPEFHFKLREFEGLMWYLLYNERDPASAIRSGSAAA